MMALVLPDPETEYGARIARRLRQDMIGWITSVDQAGTPQPAPVWFLWDDVTSSVLLYSQPTAKRLDRMRSNPRTTLHLNDDGAGQDFAVFTGQLVEGTDVPSADHNPAYVRKYDDWMTKVFGSAEQFASMFSVPLIFQPDRIRGQ